MPVDINVPDLIPIEEAVRRYGITRDAIYYHAKKKNLTTFRKIGDKRAYVRVSDMEGLRLRATAGQEAPAMTEEELLEAHLKIESESAGRTIILDEKAKAELALFLRKFRDDNSAKARAAKTS
ncbi:MAG: hypothetical protein J0I20_06925 [Chloroflexi bacterium]|nr:hypothetical protein [Chloroflexota bacterium]OJV95162.1 MAG: hypothetical protein BGO39_24420 [Chloroflexi bacterium 54-19]